MYIVTAARPTSRGLNDGRRHYRRTHTQKWIQHEHPPPTRRRQYRRRVEDIGFAIGFLERHDDNNPDFEFDAGGALAALRIIRGALKPLVDRDRTAIGQSAVTRVINETVEREHQHPDLAATVVALQFACASLAEAYDTLHDGHAWLGRLDAAHFVVMGVKDRIEEAISVKPFTGAEFFLLN